MYYFSKYHHVGGDKRKVKMNFVKAVFVLSVVWFLTSGQKASAYAVDPHSWVMEQLDDSGYVATPKTDPQSVMVDFPEYRTEEEPDPYGSLWFVLALVAVFVVTIYGGVTAISMVGPTIRQLFITRKEEQLTLALGR